MAHAWPDLATVRRTKPSPSVATHRCRTQHRVDCERPERIRDENRW